MLAPRNLDAHLPRQHVLRAELTARGRAVSSVFDLPQKLLSVISSILGRFARMTLANSWIIYAILGVLVFLILMLVATQWKVKSEQAKDLRASSLIMLGVIAAAMVAWYFIPQEEFQCLMSGRTDAFSA